MLGLADVKEATSRAKSAVDKVGRGALESLLYLEVVLVSPEGSERGGVGTDVGVKFPSVAGGNAWGGDGFVRKGTRRSCKVSGLY